MSEQHPLQRFGEYLNKTSAEEIRQMADDTRQLISYYRCAMWEIETKFRVLDEQLSLNQSGCRIQALQSRIKTMPSIHEKLLRRGQPFTLQSIEENLFDIAGVRVICSFVDDIYLLADGLLKQDDVRLIEKKDYIQFPKDSGYRSLHLIIEIPIFLFNEKRPTKVEVQLRTIAMESWANLEHHLRYKKQLLPETKAVMDEELLECALLSHELDRKMQRLRNML
ncbi:MAG: GTP pyrophosphokinase family protein [Firmicutes bacterium]|nr:GTP pyrophosphokinase family protein [Bacillota bacterium]MBR7113408.1 GTP pyrophosphokinase family protein [Bacillota bacterium]